MYIAIDFDGTIVEHRYPELGEPVPGALEWIKQFKEAGATLILWTMRSDGPNSGDVLSQAVQYCLVNGIEFDYINENPQSWTTSSKAYAEIYIDDAAFGCPLKPSTKQSARPFVDWAVVGPAVLEKIEDKNKRSATSSFFSPLFPLPGKES